MLSCEFCEISKNTFFTEHVWTTASITAKAQHENDIIETQIKMVLLLESVYISPCL